MQLISYNVNGIRAAISKGFIDWLSIAKPDVLCLQETKAQPEQIECKLFNNLGYQTIWHSAQKKGYSGVGIVSRIKPDNIFTGLGVERFDSEGRVLRADFADLTLINVYIPSGTTGSVRQEVKMDFLNAFFDFLIDLRQTRKKIIITGDFNICHKPIDINHPERHTKTSGFLPEEREWLDKLINTGFIDTFRRFNSEPDQYSWWTYRAGAREKNLGWRIDYFFITEELEMQLNSASIQNSVAHSDHCPITLSLNN